MIWMTEEDWDPRTWVVYFPRSFRHFVQIILLERDEREGPSWEGAVRPSLASFISSGNNLVREVANRSADVTGALRHLRAGSPYGRPHSPPAHNGKEWKSCGSLLAPSCSPAARLTDDGNDKNKVSKKYIFSYHISFTSQIYYALCCG